MIHSPSTMIWLLLSTVSFAVYPAARTFLVLYPFCDFRYLGESAYDMLS